MKVFQLQIHNDSTEITEIDPIQVYNSADLTLCGFSEDSELQAVNGNSDCECDHRISCDSDSDDDDDNSMEIEGN